MKCHSIRQQPADPRCHKHCTERGQTLPCRRLPSGRTAGGFFEEQGTVQCGCWQTPASSTSEVEVSGRSSFGGVRYYLPAGFLLPLCCRFPFSPESWMNVKHIHSMITSTRNWRCSPSACPCPDPTRPSFLRQLTLSPQTSRGSR